MADATCASCGKGLAPNDVLYDAEAPALTCLLAALLGLAALMTMFALGFWACAIISVSAGLFAANSMVSNGERFLRYLSAADKTVIWVFTLGGLGIAMFETLSMFGIIPLLFHFR